MDAHYKGGMAMLSGVIVGKGMDDTYDIEYTDGQIETEVPIALIRASMANGDKREESDKPDTGADAGDFSVGTRVEGRYKGKAKYYPGTIVRTRLDGSYDVQYDDGEKEIRVSRNLIRVSGGESRAYTSPSRRGGGSKSPRAAGSSPGEGVVIREGDTVEAKFEGRGRYLPARITRDRGDGTYDLEYSDGRREYLVMNDNIRVGVGSISRSTSFVGGSIVRTGDKVEARYKGEKHYTAGTVVATDVDDTFDIEYDDGRIEFGVSILNIRKLNYKGHLSNARDSENIIESNYIKGSDLLLPKVGDVVEARYKGEEQYTVGTVVGNDVDDTFDIEYENGRVEFGVPHNYIRKPISTPTIDRDLQAGDRVVKLFKEKGTETSQLLSGVVSCRQLDGSYDVEYDSGEKETGVPRDLIKLANEYSKDETSEAQPPRPLSRRSFREGDSIECKFEGKGRHLPGRIVRDYGDNTYDLLYVDGGKEFRVEGDRIRATESEAAVQAVVDMGSTVRTHPNNHHSPSSSKQNKNENELPKNHGDSQGPENEQLFQRGDAVESRFHGGAQWLQGLVTNVNSDGSYSIFYHHYAYEEKHVPASHIRPDRSSRKPLSSSSTQGMPATSSSHDIQVGDEIEALHNVTGSYVEGKISRKNLDGTVDVQYSDGRNAFGVPRDLIRLKSIFEIGTKVQAPFKGSSKYYPGVITRKRLNGTFDIHYDDGQNEMAVEPAVIRKAEDAVEAAISKNIIDAGHRSVNG